MKASELIKNPDGSVYHLALKPGQIADKIIFVGDQKRVDRFVNFFDHIEFQQQKREFHTLTGTISGQRVSVISTGIGTDNIDIVWNELDALANIDLFTGRIKDQLSSLKVLRLGTCGGLQPEISVGSFVNSIYAIGSDALLHYYPVQKEYENLRSAFLSFWNKTFPSCPEFYATGNAESLNLLLGRKYPNVIPGITFTAAGFYAPQGRNQGRAGVRFTNLPARLAAFNHHNIFMTNMEMETSGILGLGKTLGHEAGSISVILANRHTGEFSSDPARDELNLIETGLEILMDW